MNVHSMADEKKSREVRKPIIEVGDCEHDVCCGTGECKTTNSESVGELTISIQADVKDALTGFKALQRKLRETTKAARELEQAYKDAENVAKFRTYSIGTESGGGALKSGINK